MLPFTFHHIAGQELAKLALALAAVNPRCGGVLFVGASGTGKSLLALTLRELLPSHVPITKVPLHVTEDAWWGTCDLEEALARGKEVVTQGILERSRNGVLFVDDLNLLPRAAMGILTRALDEGNRLLVGTANPIGGPVHPALSDRIGLYAFMDDLPEMAMRGEVVRRHLSVISPDGEARSIVERARCRIPLVRIGPQIHTLVADLANTHGFTGHRGDLYLIEAARAYAALVGDAEVTQEHLQVVSPLVLSGRIADSPSPSDPTTHPSPAEASPTPQEEGKDKQAHEAGEPTGVTNQIHGKRKDEVFEVGNAYRIRPITFPNDRRGQITKGNRTPSRTSDTRGQATHVTPTGRGDVALGATVRAAAPHQMRRGRRDHLIIRQEDLRFRRREPRTGHVVIFVTDASGSMGVKRRMVETKGTIMSLLLDCYHHREQVALITFRRTSAEVVLPPTTSLILAVRRLREIPVGGKTPLSAGLLEAYKLIRAQRYRNPTNRFLVVLITDGRANHSLTGRPVMDELGRLAQVLGDLPHTDFLVVDTEDKASLLKTDRAQRIARLLHARYYPMAELRHDALADMVRTMPQMP